MLSFQPSDTRHIRIISNSSKTVSTFGWNDWQVALFERDNRDRIKDRYEVGN